MTHTLTVEERASVIQCIVTHKLLPELQKKGTDYSKYISSGHKEGEVAANANFGAIADWLRARGGVDKYVVWATFFLKHIQAIMTWVCTRQTLSEKLEGRLIDSVNYLLILWTMLIEDEVILMAEVQ